MKIHEYQAKEILKNQGVRVPAGKTAEDPSEVARIIEELGGDGWVIKVQIHAGGRGKGGGVKVVSDAREAREVASRLLGSNLVTPQTGPEGKPVRRLLVEQRCDAARELYLGITVDRAAAKPVLMASGEGGIEIEEIAASSPEKITRVTFDLDHGLYPYQMRRIFDGLKLDRALEDQAAATIRGLVNTFRLYDCSLSEINPLVITSDGRVIALDVKLVFDDNALFRHPEIRELRDPEQEDPLELEASKYRLSYIKLKGNIGCMVNGAGLAMATMDLIKKAGGEPANFLDVGGGADKEMIRNAFRILLSDPNVKAVLINIFGGILRCDVLAQGIVDAISAIEVAVPVIVRLEGTNVELGREILNRSNLEFTLASSMKEAAHKAVEAVLS